MAMAPAQHPSDGISNLPGTLTASRFFGPATVVVVSSVINGFQSHVTDWKFEAGVGGCTA